MNYSERGSRQVRKSRYHSLGMFGVMFGAFAAIIFGDAVINASDGQAWAIELCHSVAFVLSATFIMGTCVLCSVIGIAGALRNGDQS